jgi:hypothetical protein
MAAKATIRTAGSGSGEGDLPSQEITKASTGMGFATDVRGRRIAVVKPSAILRMRLLRMLGKDADNGPLLGNCMLACLVREIDGDKIMMPNSYREIEMLVERLDDDGLAAVVDALKELGVEPKIAEDDEDTIRNL